MTITVHPSWLCSDCLYERQPTCPEPSPCWGGNPGDLTVDLDSYYVPMPEQQPADAGHREVMRRDVDPTGPHPSWNDTARAAALGRSGCSHGKGWVDVCLDCRSTIVRPPGPLARVFGWLFDCAMGARR